MSEAPDALAPREEEVDTYYEPAIRIAGPVEIKNNEEDEDVFFKMRAKLFRFNTDDSEWKERGTGDVKLLEHRETKKCRLVMRRDKTLKVCANHFVSSEMKLQPNIGSDRSWVWKVPADYADSTPTPETLAIRFANSENANQFKTAFEDAQKRNAALPSAVKEAEEGEEKESGKAAEVEKDEVKEDGEKEGEEKKEGEKKEGEKEDEAEAEKKDDTA